jgi:endonuclease/exonuclease/phosphatase family metal-dependent hydrolase
VLLTVLTWNLKGSEPTDIDVVADAVTGAGADLVLLQEVQQRQARRIARAVGAVSRRWSFKHWPIRTCAEGMAVIGVTVDADVHARTLTARWKLWSWRRRVLQEAQVEGGLRVLNVHLSPHNAVATRAHEVGAVLARLNEDGRLSVVAGDLNERPNEPGVGRLLAAGLRDAWALVRPDDDEERAATNWHRWATTRGGPPNRRLDYVLVSPEVAVRDVWSPRFGDDGFSSLAELSDHLPVAARLDTGTADGSS